MQQLPRDQHQGKGEARHLQLKLLGEVQRGTASTRQPVLTPASLRLWPLSRKQPVA